MANQSALWDDTLCKIVNHLNKDRRPHRAVCHEAVHMSTREERRKNMRQKGKKWEREEGGLRRREGMAFRTQKGFTKKIRTNEAEGGSQGGDS